MTSSIRSGLPRTSGGDPWPPQGTPPPPTDFVPTPVGPGDNATAQAVAQPEPQPAVSDAAEAPAPSADIPAQTPAPVAGTFRRGLPRVEGGEPWPPADAVPEGLAAQVAQPQTAPDTQPEAAAPAPATTTSSEPAVPAAAATGADASTQAGLSGSGPARRGLPRVEGGDPWPPEGTVVSGAFQAHPAQAQPAQAPASEAPAPAAPAQPVEASPTPAQEPAAAPAQAAPAQPAPAQATPAQTAPAQATPARPAPTPAAAKTPAQPAKPAAATSGAAASEAKRYGPFTMKQWVGAGAVIALAIVGLVALVVMAARWFAGLEFMQSFLATYPGEYDLPDSAPIGFPGWLGWQHFFNIFLMILIIRSGLLVRTQERPPAYWTSKRKPKKISIQLWLHQSLNLLWIINGLIFVILLFATGHWMRVIPTSPEVFPNAASALLQYLTLDWPTDNGWVNYNSLQQIAYFLTIFIAAPLSAITGYRMSEAWPEKSKLGTKFSIEGARKLHFPLMIYFIGFIVVHVALVFSTGALRNLNHMFAAQGSADPSVYANNWTGFWLFVASVVVVVIGWIAARPMIMAPIARIFGNVSAR